MRVRVCEYVFVCLSVRVCGVCVHVRKPDGVQLIQIVTYQTIQYPRHPRAVNLLHIKIPNQLLIIMAMM